MFNRLNIIFVKWNFFFKKYIERIARFVKGYSVDSTGQVVLKSELPLDSKNLSFWLLTLQKEGAEKVVTKKESFYNIQWDLTTGENNFFELYGKLEDDFVYTQEFFSSVFVNNKHLFREYLLSTLIDQGLLKEESLLKVFGNHEYLDFSLVDVVITNDNLLKLKVSTNVELTLFDVKNRKNFKSNSKEDCFQKLQQHEHSYARLFSENEMHNIVLQHRNNFVKHSPVYDVLSKYHNLFDYESTFEGRNFVEAFEDIINQGSIKGKFKLLPTIVENIDKSIDLQDTIAFSNFFRTLSFENWYLNQCYTQLSNRFLPFDIINLNNKNNGIFSESFYSDTFIFNFENCLDNFQMNLALIDQKNTNIFPSQETSVVNSQLNANFVTDYVSVTNSLCNKSFGVSMLNTADVSWFHLVTLFSKVFDFFHNNLSSEYITYRLFHEYLKGDSMLISSVFSYYPRLLNLATWESFFKKKYYLNVVSFETLVLNNWFLKMKELFILKTEVSRNFGAYLEPTTLQKDDEAGVENTKEESDDDFILASNFTYKFFLNDVYEPFITNPGHRPYKWLSIPQFQYSPFLYFFDNFKLFWLHLFKFYPGLSFVTHKTVWNDSLIDNSLDATWFRVIKRLVYLRYLQGNDREYLELLQWWLNPILYFDAFGDYAKMRASFFFSLDSYLLHQQTTDDLDNTFVFSTVKKIFNYMPKSLFFFEQTRDLDFISLLHTTQTASSFINVPDWLLNAEKRSADLLRLSWLYKSGITSSHFNFFAFMSPDFFDRNVNYQAWMKHRTLDRVPDPENPFLILDFYRPHTVELTSDITLLKYRLDFLKLMFLGFDDVVFEKDIFVKDHYGYSAERRDVFEMPEYTVPFFFFDSDLDSSSFVPTKPVYERVSSFGIPSLDRPWKIEEYMNIDSDKIDVDWYLSLEEDLKNTEEDSTDDYYLAILKSLWKKDKPAFLFSEIEIVQIEKINQTIWFRSNLAAKSDELSLYVAKKIPKFFHYLKTNTVLSDRDLVFVGTMVKRIANDLQKNLVFYWLKYFFDKKNKMDVSALMFHRFDSLAMVVVFKNFENILKLISVCYDVLLKQIVLKYAKNTCLKYINVLNSINMKFFDSCIFFLIFQKNIFSFLPIAEYNQKDELYYDNSLDFSLKRNKLTVGFFEKMDLDTFVKVSCTCMFSEFWFFSKMKEQYIYLIWYILCFLI